MSRPAYPEIDSIYNRYSDELNYTIQYNYFINKRIDDYRLCVKAFIKDTEATHNYKVEDTRKFNYVIDKNFVDDSIVRMRSRIIDHTVLDSKIDSINNFYEKHKVKIITGYYTLLTLRRENSISGKLIYVYREDFDNKYITNGTIKRVLP